jgi:hypothetical protein
MMSMQRCEFGFFARCCVIFVSARTEKWHATGLRGFNVVATHYCVFLPASGEQNETTKEPNQSKQCSHYPVDRNNASCYRGPEPYRSP